MTSADIAAGLSRLGLREGDTVLVHSSLSSFGAVSGGANAAIDALLTAVGTSGTVLVPTFGCTDTVFDSATSETGLGAIPRAFRRPFSATSRPGKHSLLPWIQDAPAYGRAVRHRRTRLRPPHTAGGRWPWVPAVSVASRVGPPERSTQSTMRSERRFLAPYRVELSLLESDPQPHGSISDRTRALA